MGALSGLDVLGGSGGSGGGYGGSDSGSNSTGPVRIGGLTVGRGAGASGLGSQALWIAGAVALVALLLLVRR